jgi:hypothetical protein
VTNPCLFGWLPQKTKADDLYGNPVRSRIA